MPRPPIIRVASTGNEPEIVDRIQIARAAAPRGKRTVVLSLGPDSKGDLPLEGVRPGDRLRIFAELEVTTDYKTRTTGSIGDPYSYVPAIEAAVLLTADRKASKPAPGRAVAVGRSWTGSCTHRQHHRVIDFGELEYTVPRAGLGWNGPTYVNVTLRAANPAAKRGQYLLVGQNQPVPKVGVDMAGIRVVQLRPRSQPAVPSTKTRKLRVSGVPTNERKVVVYSKPIRNLRSGEQLLVKARLRADSSGLGYVARLTTRLFVAESQTQVEPGGKPQKLLTWKGHLSKPNGSNCLPEEGAQAFVKFGVTRALKASAAPLYVNLVAVSGDPSHKSKAGDKLPLLPGGFLEVTRYGAKFAG